VATRLLPVENIVTIDSVHWLRYGAVSVLKEKLSYPSEVVQFLRFLRRELYNELHGIYPFPLTNGSALQKEVPVGWGAVVFAEVYAICEAAFFPGTPFDLAAGFAFGPWIGSSPL